MFSRKPSEQVPPPPNVAPPVWTNELVERFRKSDYLMVKLTSLTDNVSFQQIPGHEVRYGCICKGQVLHFVGGPVKCFLNLNASLKGDKPMADLGSLDSELTVCVGSNNEALFFKIAKAFEWAALSRRLYIHISLHNKSIRGKMTMSYTMDYIQVYSEIDLDPHAPS